MSFFHAILSQSAAAVIPVNTVAPTLTVPLNAVGQTATINPGTYSGTTSVKTYKFYRDGVQIYSGSLNTYILASADLETTLTGEETATNTAGSASVTTNAYYVINPISLTGITTDVMLGDSIMVSNNASPASNCFRAKFTAHFSFTESNQSLGGSGVWNEVKVFSQLSFTRNVTIVVEEGGLNDIRNSHATKTFNKIQSCLDTILKRCFQSASVASGGASVVRSGSFTGFPASTHGGRYPSGTLPGNFASFNTTDNATWSYTFTGTAIAVTLNASDGSAARGTAEIRIDGVLVDTLTDLEQRYDGVSDGVYDNTKGPHTWTYFGLTNASHTIQVKALTAASPVVVDEFNILDAAANVGIVFVMEIPKITNYTQIGRDQASDAYINQANTIKKALVAKYKAQGYKIRFVPTMLNSGGIYATATGIDTDGVHPTNTGHTQLYNSLLQATI